MWPRQKTTRTAPWPQPHHASLCSSVPLLIGGSARRVRTLTQNGRARPPCLQRRPVGNGTPHAHARHRPGAKESGRQLATLARKIHQAREFCGDCSVKTAIHVANRCSNELPCAPQPPCSTIRRFPSTSHLSAARSSQLISTATSPPMAAYCCCEKRSARSVCAGDLPKRCPIAAMQTASDTRCSK
jgi:hypothetical protein